MRRFMSGSGGFGAMYRMAGFEPSPRATREGFLELVAGRIYMDAAAAGEMFFQDFPFRYDLNLLKYDPDAALAPPTIPCGSIRARIASGRKVSAANRKLRQLAEDLDGQLNSRIIPGFVSWCEQQRRMDLTGLSGEDMVGLWRGRETRVMDEFAPLSLLPSLISGMALADLRALLAENFWQDQDDIEELAGELAATATPDKTMQLSADLYALARGRLSLDDWMSAHGHRAMEEFDLSAQRWRERPDEVLKMAARLKDGPDPMELYKARREGVTGQLESLRAALRPADRDELDRQVALARRYMIFRENGKYYLMLGYALLRDVALEAGRRLGLGEDVFLLTAEEMQDALRTGTVPADALTDRKAEHRAASRLVLPRVIDAATVDALGEPPKTSAGDHYPAVAVSAGVASGPVRIVRSPHAPGDLGRGYVLVCASTDPAWTPLFVGAAGLVMECGGTLSHGALVAREMGIPAVVLPGATELLRPGETIFVDGRHGRVGRHAAAEGEADSYRPAADDVRIAHALAPPPRGRAERKAAKWRRAFLIGWGAYLLAAFLLPDHILYQPSLRVLDALLWPLTGLLGRTGVVVLVAAVLAVLTMVGQRRLTDQPRLREAKRRAAALARQAAGLPRESPRRQAMTRLAGQVYP
jgi:pyruvate,water dikinase